jgi:hypothetical protein
MKGMPTIDVKKQFKSETEFRGGNVMPTTLNMTRGLGNCTNRGSDTPPHQLD